MLKVSFWLASGAMFCTQCLALVLWEHGIAEIWRGPHPVMATLLFIYIGLLVPLYAAAIHYYECRNRTQGILNVIAASMLIFSTAFAAETTLQISRGAALEAMMIASYVPAAICIALLSAGMYASRRTASAV